MEVAVSTVVLNQLQHQIDERVQRGPVRKLEFPSSFAFSIEIWLCFVLIEEPRIWEYCLFINVHAEFSSDISIFIVIGVVGPDHNGIVTKSKGVGTPNIEIKVMNGS